MPGSGREKKEKLVPSIRPRWHPKKGKALSSKNGRLLLDPRPVDGIRAPPPKPEKTRANRDQKRKKLGSVKDTNRLPRKGKSSIVMLQEAAEESPIHQDGDTEKKKKWDLRSADKKLPSYPKGKGTIFQENVNLSHW